MSVRKSIQWRGKEWSQQQAHGFYTVKQGCSISNAIVGLHPGCDCDDGSRYGLRHQHEYYGSSFKSRKPKLGGVA